ncbi:hypothetical protein M431DRAFT_199537 [Trichoderma harzianum CBS 226.95]|uniref:Uncharacterized protein n=1 Tax=Trichoderma harzianum CBS 226.95 TaxID=983964 RepID=A0A2T4AV01_TRIHA|nr:hypothetical protein M431DRAFT_199537 [Trichoderma harzianum CBS 226.95]PTB60897.1 hypothetical protein M431DRAFT_199537 [Trichoderma harzianum CBS 226.95]
MGDPMVQHGETFHGGPSTVNPSFATPNLHLIAHCARAILSSHHHQKRDQKKKKKKRGRLTAATHQQHAQPDKRLRSTRRLAGSALLCSDLLCSTQGICALGKLQLFFSFEAIVESSRSAFAPSPAPVAAPLQTPDARLHREPQSRQSLSCYAPCTALFLRFFALLCPAIAGVSVLSLALPVTRRCAIGCPSSLPSPRRASSFPRMIGPGS